jgi:hypothetical protein
MVTPLIIIANVTDCDKSNFLCMSNSVGLVRVYKVYFYCYNFVIAKYDFPLCSSIDLLTAEQTVPEFTPNSNEGRTLPGTLLQSPHSNYIAYIV